MRVTELLSWNPYYFSNVKYGFFVFKKTPMLDKIKYGYSDSTRICVFGLLTMFIYAHTLKLQILCFHKTALLRDFQTTATVFVSIFQTSKSQYPF